MPKSKFLTAALAATAFIGVSAPASANDWIDELRVGAYDHDSNLAATRHETSRPDINGEVLFKSPDWLSWAFAPRPMIGTNVSTGGGTSIAYAGLAWTFDLTDALFIEGTFGGAIHNGHTSEHEDSDRRNYGCRAMFHESASVGYRFTDSVSLMLTIDHMSNASLCDSNPGLTDAGARLGFKF